jgi:zinc protease
MRPLIAVAALVALGGAAVAKPTGPSSKNRQNHQDPKAGPSSKSANAFPFAVETHTLPSGLRVVFVPFDSPGLMAYYTVMRVGSRNEPEAGRSGYAHFFEHMMFRGTPTHSAEEYNQTLTKLGLNMNASTGSDVTIYNIYGPHQALPTVIDYEADRFAHLAYDENQFKTEAGAILGEYAKSASSPALKLVEKLLETAYGQHTYRHTTIGYLADVQAMPSGFAYSREFFRRYYTPDNATVVIVGDFDKQATLAHLTRAYAGWKGKLDAAAIPAEPAQTEARRAHIDWKLTVLPRLVLAWHAPAATDVDAAAIQALLEGYLFGPTSALYQDLVIQRQLVDDLDSWYEPLRDPGLFALEAQVKEAKDLPEVERTIVTEVAKLGAGAIDGARLEAVRSNQIYGRLLRYDTAPHVAYALGHAIGTSGDPQYITKVGARMAKITPAELAAFAKRWLVDANRSTVTLTTSGAAAEGAR